MEPRTNRIYLIAFSLFAVLLAIGIPSRAQAETLPEFRLFVEAVATSDESAPRGIYVPNVMALRIVDQPAGDAAYVSSMANTVTDFRMARAYGNTGLLAHNYLAGASFSSLEPGQVIYLVQGNGAVKKYMVSEILRFQAYEPLNPNSRFLNLDGGAEYSAAELFDQVYQGPQHLTLQTCIASDGDLNWGRLFVIAEPLPARFPGQYFRY